VEKTSFDAATVKSLMNWEGSVKEGVRKIGCENG
jgi:hypothetical protein